MAAATLCRRRLHGLVGHRQQLARQGIQVDLVSEPGAEGLNGYWWLPSAVTAEPAE
jgi:hypothetical protein